MIAIVTNNLGITVFMCTDFNPQISLLQTYFNDNKNRRRQFQGHYTAFHGEVVGGLASTYLTIFGFTPALESASEETSGSILGAILFKWPRPPFADILKVAFGVAAFGLRIVAPLSSVAESPARGSGD